MRLDAIVDALAPAGARRTRSARPAGGVTIVDDAYNASPGSVAAALELLAGLPAGGSPSSARCSSSATSTRRPSPVGEAAAAIVDRLVVVGAAPAGSRGALAAGLATRSSVGRRPRRGAGRPPPARAGDVVLVKASRGIALDVLVDELVARSAARRRPPR
jgi:UDP-N-acetylmuramoyl-tripeptide--D-alanyl-D-alanine ligase